MQIFSPIPYVAFSFVDGFFCCEEAFKFDIVPLDYFCFYCLCKKKKKSLLRPTPRRFFLFFVCLFKRFRDSGLIFKSLIHFKLIFVSDKIGASINLLHAVM